jgi:uncharacterized MAPEG superfamily protein
MTIPMWVLLAFAAWTLAILMASVGVYRWSQIFTGRAAISGWRADGRDGADWYQRAMRAHMNCVENLPVFGAIVVVMFVTGVSGPAFDRLAIIFLVARIGQSLVHISVPQTEPVAALRFSLFSVQIACMLAMGVMTALGA